MKLWLKIVLGLLAVLAALSAVLYTQLRQLEVERLSADLHVLRGVGGNVAVLRTDAGAVVVDSMTLPLQGARIRAIALELTGTEPVLLINTHYHLDHTHGNPAFEPGTRVLSTERTLEHLDALDADFWTGDAAALKPNETFTDRQTLTVGRNTLELVHPGAGHTDGDLVVLFPDQGVVHMGDLLFAGHYPNIDLEAGGTVRGWPAALDEVLKLPFDRAIPGHGPTTSREGIVQFQRFLQQLGAIGAAAARNGQPVEAVIGSAELTEDAGYQPITFFGLSLGLDRSFVLRRAWEEATGNFTPAAH